MSARKMLVVFDIDETLIQYIGGKFNPLWQERKSMFSEDSYTEIPGRNGEVSTIIFRPKLRELMELFKNDKFFVPAMWTYSDREYGEGIAKAIVQKYNLPADTFLFVKGAEDMDEDSGIPKDLTIIYEEYPEFGKFNTILVDDRYGNINNSSNRENGLVIQPYAPFGPEKEREKLGEEEFRHQMNDNVFTSLIEIMKAIKKDIQGCDDEDYEMALNTEGVFIPKRVKRMKLDKFYQTFATEFKQLVSIGVPYLTKKFILIPKYDSFPSKYGGKWRKTKRGGSSKKRRTRKRNRR